MKEYDEIKLNGNIPAWMKYLMLFIDRVGFPVLAFCLMFYMSYVSLEKVTSALHENTTAVAKFVITTEQFQGRVALDHNEMKSSLTKIYDNSFGHIKALTGRDEKV